MAKGIDKEMVDENGHGACVDAWIERAASGLSPERLIEAFEGAFASVWRRAHQTLGDVTLAAIADRVLYNAAEQFPVLTALEIEATGIRCREDVASRPVDQLTETVRFVFVEFLTVLGNLTGQILTPALHAELARVGRQERRADSRPNPERNPGGGTNS